MNLSVFSFLPSSKPQLLDKWGMHKKLLVSNYREWIYYYIIWMDLGPSNSTDDTPIFISFWKIDGANFHYEEATLARDSMYVCLLDALG